MINTLGKEIVKNFTLLGLLVFLFGYMYSEGFLGFFNVNPLAYLSNTEFLYTVLPVVSLLAYGVGGVLSSESKSNEDVEKKYSLYTSRSTDNSKQFLNKTTVILLGLVSFSFSFFVCQMVFNVKFLPPQLTPYASLIFYFFLILLVGLRFWYTLIFGDTFSTSNTFALVIVCLFFCRNLGSANAESLIKSQPEKTFEFIFRGKKIGTGKTFLLIKETQSTLLFYNTQDSTTHIYKRDEIDSLTVKKVKAP